MSNRTISPLGLAQIQAHEGFWPEAVSLGDGRMVAGYGHVCHAPLARPMTRPEAAALLAADVAPVERAVDALVERPLSQSQFDALVSFAHSVGVEAFAQSDVLRRVRAGEFAAAAYAMDAWRRSAVSGESAVLETLVRRRTAERALLLAESAGAPSVWLRPELDHAAAILGAPAAFGTLPSLTPPNAEIPTPANDSEPLALTQRVEALPVPAEDFVRVSLRAPKARPTAWGQAVLGFVTVAGLCAAGWAGYNYYERYVGMGDALLLGAPGIAAALAGLFFLTRRARPVFA